MMNVSNETVECSQDFRLLKDESWSGCSKRCSLFHSMVEHDISSWWLYGGLVAISALIGIRQPGLLSSKLGTFVISFYMLLGALLLHEHVLCKLAGAVVYQYRSYFDLNTRDRLELEGRVNRLIAEHKIRVINQAPSPALVEKWRNHAQTVICTSSKTS